MKKLLIALTLSSVLCVSANAADVVAVGFSNGDGSYPTALSVVLQSIKSAKQTINVASYSFTSKPIAEALVAAKNRGVTVQVVADEKSNQRYSAVTFLANAGVPVTIQSNYAIFHNKFMVIDGACVETGSFNYTAGAVNKNAENAILICDGATAQAYTKEFNYWYSSGSKMNARY